MGAVETQQEKFQYFCLRKSKGCLFNDDDTGTSCHSTSARGLRLATVRGKKDTPSLIDVRGLGCPTEFSGKEEDFQQWSKKTEAFFSGVIKESEMILEWSAEQATEITTTAIGLEFLQTNDCGTRSSKPGVRAAADAFQQSWFSRVMRQIAPSPTRGRTRWRHGEVCGSDMIRQQVEGNETCCELSFLLLSSGTSSGDRTMGILRVAL